MGQKPSNSASTSLHGTMTKRKRSNTQASHPIPFEKQTSQRQNTQHQQHRQPQQQQCDYTYNTTTKSVIPTPAHVEITYSAPEFNTKKCEELFMHYADSDLSNLITPDGNKQFFEDLGLSIEDALIFAIACKMKIETMGYITKEEWMSCMKDLQADSIEKLEAKRPEFEDVFNNPEKFQEMYKFIFGYVKDKEKKCIETGTACVLWSMLLGQKFPIVHEFIAFLHEEKPVKVINRDQWKSFLEFVSSDISNYDESSAWPVLFDSFVEWKREQQ